MALISRVRQGAALRALITAALLMSAVTLQGQETSGRVTGVVADSTGAVIPGATVTLKDGQTGISRNTVSNDLGVFVFSGAISDPRPRIFGRPRPIGPNFVGRGCAGGSALI